MRLERLQVERLPGIEGSFEIREFSPGLNLIVGPNASGKSSIRRILRATLWPEPRRNGEARVRSWWNAAGQTLTADLAGAVSWQREGAPTEAPRLPGAHLAHCTHLALRDLLGDEAGDDERALLEEIRIQLSGGFDLWSLRASVSQKPSIGRKQREALLGAEKERRRLEAVQVELAREEAGLGARRQEYDSAVVAEREVAAIDRALRFRALDRERSELESQLEDFPPHLARLRGGELEEWLALEEDFAAARRDWERARDELAEASEERAGYQLGDAVDERALAAEVERARGLASAAPELDRLERERDVRAEELRAAERVLAGDLAEEFPTRVDALAGEALDQLDSWWSEAVTLREKRASAESRRDHALAELAEDSSGPAENTLREAAAALRAWCGSQSGAPPMSPARWAVVGALVLATSLVPLWAGSQGAAAGPLWLLPGLLVGGALVALWLGRRDGSAHHARRFEQLRIAGPEEWSVDAVTRRLEDLEAEIEVQRRRSSAAQLEVEWRLELEKIEKRQSKLVAERRSLMERLGVACGESDLALQDLVDRVRVWRASALRARAAAREFESAANRQRRELAQVNAFLSVQGEDVQGEEAADDWRVAGQRLEDLNQRVARAGEAARREASASKQLVRAVARLEGLEQRRTNRIDALGFEGTDPSSLRGELEALFERRPEYEDLRSQLQDTQRSLRDLEVELAGSADLLSLEARELERRRGIAAAEAAEREARGEFLGRIGQRLDDARGSDSLERAIDREMIARVDLDAERDALRRSLVAEWLLDEVEAEHEEHSRPPVLQRAMSTFANFTQNKFQLRLDTSGEEPRFLALDSTSGRGIPLPQMSDGTKMQLWLAARIAFALEQEGAESLPLFLDEALSASDPERFEAVAKSVCSMVEDGRQVFYLTCDVDDVDRWQSLAARMGTAAPAVVDLAELRALSNAAPRESLARQREPFPEPAGRDAATYGALLRVPAPKRFDPPDRLHLFHLLRDDLEMLHRLVDSVRIERVGQWRSFSGNGEAATWLGAQEKARLDALAELAHHFVEAWAVGRGRPLHAEALTASGAVTPRFLERFEPVLAEVEGDAARFLERLESNQDSRVKGFGAKRRSLLVDYLEEQGYCDPRAVLELHEVRAQVMARLQAELEAGSITRETIAARVEELFLALEGDR